MLRAFTAGGIDDARLASELQQAGTKAFADSWRDLMQCIATKKEHLTKGL
jgi:transaldolase